jgi:arsenical pump membrane protein
VINIAIWLISCIAMAGVIIRPFKTPEAAWAVTGAIMLVIFRLLQPSEALHSILKGVDVYLFLTGMMMLAEVGREEKLFGWLAAQAVNMAKGSPARLFLLVYLAGTVVTAFLSNDATAVVLTPAVAAATKAAKVKNPLPYLLICAFIANAASFILPISNPANLVIYANQMPDLLRWLPQYILPSIASVLVTCIMLFYLQRKELKGQVEKSISMEPLSPCGKTALSGILATAAVLLACSAFGLSLGLPTAVTGLLVTAIVTIKTKKSLLVFVKDVSWPVLPLVAGLFVIVGALNKTGAIQLLAGRIQQGIAHSVTGVAWVSGMATAIACNLMNNLPAGLIAANVIRAGSVPGIIKSAILIGVDLGPNLSVTGSLATILWLVALKREGVSVSALSFLKLGFVVMITALLASLACLFI